MISKDLREKEQEVLFKAIAQIKKENPGFKLVLVVDQESLPLLSSICDTSELVTRGIVLTELYEKVRQPLPTYQAIYLLHPAVDITQFIKDFDDKPIYAAAHVLFTFTANSSVMTALEAKPNVVNHILTFMDLWIHYTPVDPTTFLIPCGGALKAIYSDSVPFMNVSIEMQRGLISFFVSNGKSPKIAYPKGNDKIKQFVSSFQQQLASTIRELDSGTRIDSESTLLMVIPRGVDPITPLLHRFSYQAMIYENVEVSSDIYRRDPNDPKSPEIYLNYYQDDIFSEYQYKHFTEWSSLSERLTDIKDLDRRFHELQNDKSNPEYVKTCIEYKKVQGKKDAISNHLDLMSRLSDAFKKRQLVEISTYEQQLAARVKDHEPYKANFGDLQGVVVMSGPDPMDKLRACGVYAAVGGKLGDKELTKVFNAAHIEDSYRDSMLNLPKLGEPLKRKVFNDPEEAEPFDTDVYQPTAAASVVAALDGKLDSKQWELPSHSGRYQNIVIFFAGGVSYAELQAIDVIRSRVKKGTRIIIGATNMLTPQQFLRQLRNL